MSKERQKKFKKICKCGHSKDQHTGFSIVQNNKIPNGNDGCMKEDCVCNHFKEEKIICVFCKEQARNDGPYDVENNEFVPMNFYCLTEGCKNFKYKKSNKTR